MNSKPAVIITGWDLDGAGCVFLFKKIPASVYSNITVVATSERKFREAFATCYSPTADVFVTSLDVGENNHDILDKENITLILPQGMSSICKGMYKAVTIFSDKTTSGTMQTYKVLQQKQLLGQLSKQDELLVRLIDDYESYTHKSPLSTDLNILYHSLPYRKTDNFLKEFANGFAGFSAHHQEIIRLFKLKYNDQYENLTKHKGVITHDGKTYSACCVFASFSIPEVLDQVQKDTKADIVINIHPESQVVSLRRAKNCTCSLRLLAKELVNGGGRDEVAGGVVTPALLALSKTFTAE